MNAIVYNAEEVCRILGIPCEREGRSVVQPSPHDELVVFCPSNAVFGSLIVSKKNPRGILSGPKELLSIAQGQVLSPQYWCLSARFPGSGDMDWEDQIVHSSLKGWRAAPLLVTAVAWLVHRVKTGENLLQGDQCRCLEVFDPTSQIGLESNGNGLLVDSFLDSLRSPRLYLAAAKNV